MPACGAFRSARGAGCGWSSTPPRRSTCTSGCTSTSWRGTSSACALRDDLLRLGGFDGYYALVFTRLTGAIVVVFDSEPESCARVQRNCALNPELGARVDVRQAYVAFETNPAENAVALDDLLARGEIPVPGLIKMDVDRAELSALTGAKALLAQHRPHLIVEVHSVELEHQCAELLLELGYRPQIVTERRWLRENRPIEHNRWIVAERA